jgi:3-methyladenine DNA glycosylase AlkD
MSTDLDRECEHLLGTLETIPCSSISEGMARVGINGRVPGIPMGDLGLAREMGNDHPLAEYLWRAGIHESRMLAALIDDPKEVTMDQMVRRAGKFDNWAICDGAGIHLFRRTPHATESVSPGPRDLSCRSRGQHSS